MTNNCSIEAGVTVIPTTTSQSSGIDVISPYTVVYGSCAERRSIDPTLPEMQTGAVQEVEDRIKADKHAFLKDNMPK